MSLHLRIEGADALIRKLGKLEAGKVLKPVIRAAAADLRGRIAQYPPASEANQPKPYPGRWYERGYGTRWARKSGGIGGRQTSQTLGRSWTHRVERSGLRGLVGTGATYAPYVQDAEQQASIHKARGWKTVQQVLKEHAPRIMAQISAAIRRALAG